ncbi:MAG: hypothetical protein IT562_15700 [Alphaproteobacteria bacterium]|nr:hypothetical protein [Alphaproteobacteria bacterium]
MKDFRTAAQDQMPKWKVAKTVAATLIGLLVGGVLMEIGAAAYYAVQVGGLVWLRPPPAPKQLDLRGQGDKRLRLHPYYGFTGRAGMRLAEVAEGRDAFLAFFGERFVQEDYPTIGFNSHGFIARVDYPYPKHDDEYVVGVFGGSVAIAFSLISHHALADALEREGVLKGRRLVMLNFANGGAKQPQQATALAYFLTLGARFDFVINLDGFNEAFIGWYNFVEHKTMPEWPFARFILGIQNIDLSEAGAPVGSAEHRKVALAARLWAGREMETRIGLIWMVSRIMARQSKNALVKIEQDVTQKSEAFDYSMPLPAAPPGTFNEVGAARIVNSWRDASIAMKGMCDGFGIPYLHVLQPNQYVTKLDYGGSNEERKRVVGLDNPPVRDFIPLVYDGYRRQSERLRAAGVDFFDASEFFDGKPSRLFNDNCCHFNYDANSLLAEAIARRMKTKP